MIRLETLDPRIKLLLMLCISTAAVFWQRVGPLLALLVLTVLLLLSGGVALGQRLVSLRGFLGLILALFLIQCLFRRGGEPLLLLGSFALVTTAGLQAGLTVSLRLLIILCAALFVLQGEIRDYLQALLQLHIPYEIAFMVLAALRFLPLLREEAQNVLAAVQMRGTRLKKTSLKQNLTVYSRILLPVVSGAIQRAEQMSIAMEARGFRAMDQRTSRRRLRLGRRDILYLAAFLVIFTACQVCFLLN